VRVKKNTVVTHPSSNCGASAKNLSVSLYPHQKEVLAQRSRELNVGRSALLQMLLEIEQREGLLLREVKMRLSGRASAGRRPLQQEPLSARAGALARAPMGLEPTKQQNTDGSQN
jgi:hypothetical protein